MSYLLEFFELRETALSLACSYSNFQKGFWQAFEYC